ncbi:hypothetical protein MPH_06227 [Macrophomina phaseolina MS6]|uniref:Altered inheritance of mitochondria protein 6 n=1 Tax=Macrophomina phaseolina (strain MS6) TaxID=1126212 RepID=K2R2G0_MACPH|nr:hypothetical protein MPH_06227 [Macrophomina phaseolina MS6]
MLSSPSSSSPSSARSSDEHFNHIAREEVTADHPPSPPAWSFKRASLISASAPSFGEYYAKLQLPFWRKILMMLRERRKAAITADAGVEYDGPSSISLLGGKHTHKGYRHSSSSVFKVARRIGLLFLAMLGALLCFFGIIHVVNILINLGPIFFQNEYFDIRSRLAGPSYGSEGLLNYPTDFTRDIKPLPCHSHNDYWRRIPLYEAISYGCVGVEADVWLFPDQSEQPELYVGHNTASLTPKRTFRSLYVDPIVEILDRTNSPATLLVSSELAPERPNGVWDTAPAQTLVLLVDFKNDGHKLWPVVQAHLGSLRSRGYLSYWNGSDFVEGPVTVVATGNAPFDLLTANTTYRDIFFDAPLAMLYEEPEPISGKVSSHQKIPSTTAISGQGATGLPPGTTADSFNSSNSYYASASFPKAVGRSHWLRGEPTAHQLHLMRGQIQGAKSRGLKPRYWGTPSWPIAMRNKMWEVLVEEGVDFLNVDDLQAAAAWDWSTRRHRTWFWR